MFGTQTAERDLGVVVSAGDTLCWEEQIRGMIGKAKQMTSWIIRNVVSRKPEVLYHFQKLLSDPIWNTQCRCGPQPQDTDTGVL